MDFFVTDILRNIFFFLDSVIYGFISEVYLLLIQIANTTLFSNDVLNEFADKVYALVGVFMLFKISFSVLSYIVNPDEFTDKNKGIGKIISNVIISLVLIIAVPMIFTEAMEIQQIVLKDDILPRLFSTSGSNNIVVSSQSPTDGSKMAVLTFEAFYKSEVNYDNIDEIFKSDINKRNPAGTDYAVKYTFFLSTIVGFVVLLLLVSFCFDIAVRSIKIGFLQILAPIPIISRIDPKKGNEIFNKWVKTCVSTYLDLFLRLIAIFFAVYIIKAMEASKFVDSITGEAASPSDLAKAFIVMGALMFAKQLPNLVKDITGLDLGKGTFTLNPLKKLSQVPVVGAGLSTAGALTGGAIAGGIAGHEAGHTWRGVAQGMWGAGAGLKGKVSLMGADGKNNVGIGTGWQSGYKSITGKDFAVFNPLKFDVFGHGEEQVKTLKTAKKDLMTQQSGLDAELQDLYKAYQAVPETNENARAELMEKIQKNRAAHGEIGKHISTIDDQIGDVKRIYHFDDSKKGDVDAALAAAKAYRESVDQRRQSAPSSSNTSSSSSSSGGSTGGSTGGSSSSSSSSGGSTGGSTGSSSSSSSGGTPTPPPSSGGTSTPPLSSGGNSGGPTGTPTGYNSQYSGPYTGPGAYTPNPDVHPDDSGGD